MHQKTTTKAKKFAKRCRGEPESRRMRWETWVRDFKPLLDAEGCPRRFETYGEELKQVLAAHQKNPLTVWTEVDGDSGRAGLVEGYHLVNRIVYFITEIPAATGTFYWVIL